MRLLRKHWFDLGGLMAVLVLTYVVINYQQLSTIQLLLWLSLTSLFIHQLEEYRYPGYFPGMINAVLYNSQTPDRYPLNTQTSLMVNVPMGWLTYFFAALFAEQYIWLGIATMLVSFGNLVAHTILFNVKGKTLYNPGMVTAILFFLPLSVWFVYTVKDQHLTGPSDWIIGVLLGIALNVVGILKLIDWMADRDTTYIFEQRQLRPGDREAVKL